MHSEFAVFDLSLRHHVLNAPDQGELPEQGFTRLFDPILLFGQIIFCEMRLLQEPEWISPPPHFFSGGQDRTWVPGDVDHLAGEMSLHPRKHQACFNKLDGPSCCSGSPVFQSMAVRGGSMPNWRIPVHAAGHP